ncbi:hypothetical protein [Mesoplasma melaleucae]|uniref:Uncharacterized protein n=1 Tax=Mesoplasma melaleucae TaxID=81459 RepID=A0A2K8NZ54_9MOLU|nr:hypothetical protein [Mesoplasma melaleucae]ATZ18011.1 hypothetical protein EMELA_v1c04680 [Mesoplasma melaleucae]
MFKLLTGLLGVVSVSAASEASVPLVLQTPSSVGNNLDEVKREISVNVDGKLSTEKIEALSINTVPESKSGIESMIYDYHAPYSLGKFLIDYSILNIEFSYTTYITGEDNPFQTNVISQDINICWMWWHDAVTDSTVLSRKHFDPLYKGDASVKAMISVHRIIDTNILRFRTKYTVSAKSSLPFLVFGSSLEYFSVHKIIFCG